MHSAALLLHLLLAAGMLAAAPAVRGIPRTYNENPFKPLPVEMMRGRIKPLKPISGAAAGRCHSIVLTEDGGAYGFGRDFAGETAVAIPEGVSRAAAGDFFSAVVMKDGTLKIFGKLRGTEKLPQAECREVYAAGNSIAVVDIYNNIHFGGRMRERESIDAQGMQNFAFGEGGALILTSGGVTIPVGDAPAVPPFPWVKASLHGKCAAVIDARGVCHFYGETGMNVASLEGVRDVMVSAATIDLIYNDGSVESWDTGDRARKDCITEPATCGRLPPAGAAPVKLLGSSGVAGIAWLCADGTVIPAGVESYAMFSWDLPADKFNSISSSASRGEDFTFYLTAPSGALVTGGTDAPDALASSMAAFIPAGLRRSVSGVVGGTGNVMVAIKDRKGVTAWGNNARGECEIAVRGRARLMCAADDRFFVIDDEGRLTAGREPEEWYRLPQDFPLREVVCMNGQPGFLALLTGKGRLATRMSPELGFPGGQLNLVNAADAWSFYRKAVPVPLPPDGASDGAEAVAPAPGFPRAPEGEFRLYIAVLSADGSVAVHDGTSVISVCSPGRAAQISTGGGELSVLDKEGACWTLGSEGGWTRAFPHRKIVRIGGGHSHRWAVDEDGTILVPSGNAPVPVLWGVRASIDLKAAAPVATPGAASPPAARRKPGKR